MKAFRYTQKWQTLLPQLCQLVAAPLMARKLPIHTTQVRAIGTGISVAGVEEGVAKVGEGEVAVEGEAVIREASHRRIKVVATRRGKWDVGSGRTLIHDPELCLTN